MQLLIILGIGLVNYGLIFFFCITFFGSIFLIYRSHINKDLTDISGFYDIIFNIMNLKIMIMLL